MRGIIKSNALALAGISSPASRVLGRPRPRAGVASSGVAAAVRRAPVLDRLGVSALSFAILISLLAAPVWFVLIRGGRL